MGSLDPELGFPNLGRGTGPIVAFGSLTAGSFVTGGSGTAPAVFLAPGSKVALGAGFGGGAFACRPGVGPGPNAVAVIKAVGGS